MWNTQEHMEAYFAIPGLGAVLHTLNLRLFPEQLAYIVNHAEDRVIIVDDNLVPLLARVAAELATVEAYVVVGDGDASALTDAAPGATVLRYDDLLAASDPTGFEYPEVDERAAAAMCYTSGTTGHPKGVVYSHRSTYLHSMASGTGAVVAYNCNDRILPIVPMFHANAWGTPYAAWLAGADLLMPGRFLQAEPLARFVAEEPVTCACAVPTIWADLLRYAEDHEVDFSRLRHVTCGGAAVPRALMERFEARFGVRILQGWGMTETSPLAAVGHPPRGVEPGTPEDLDWRALTGRVIPGVELRIVDDDGEVLPWDGEAVGEIQVRGPWVTASYYGDPAPEKFDDGWLRTGDIASVTPNGFIKITDRSKDVIKSGGRVDLVGRARRHPDGASRGRRGGGDRGARPALGRAPAGVRRHQGGLGDHLGRALRVPLRPCRQVAAARALDVHRRGAEDERREVRQEGAARAVRRRRTDGGGVAVTPTDRLRR